ncbi:hypothetical protein SDC9_186677 [bioreactor metagenome]|uniref:Uncharacterized protein n=1 Tax=bioreactor metagenome TaxID=1076179 RepID=A0A645HLM9_9ZZZZ
MANPRRKAYRACGPAPSEPAPPATCRKPASGLRPATCRCMGTDRKASRISPVDRAMSPARPADRPDANGPAADSSAAPIAPDTAAPATPSSRSGRNYHPLRRSPESRRAQTRRRRGARNARSPEPANNGDRHTNRSR